MSVEIHKVNSKTQLEAFVKFPVELYKGNPYYVPVLIADEIDMLFRMCQPNEYGHSTCLLAIKNNQIVGRIALMINLHEVEASKVRKLRFGWFDVVDDVEVTKKLMGYAALIAKDFKLEYLEGPSDMTNFERTGMLTEGFDRLATPVGLYNHAYYPEHLKRLGFSVIDEYLENYFQLPDSLPTAILDFSEKIKLRYQLQTIRFKSKSEMKPYVGPVFNLLEQTYKDLASFTPIPADEKQRFGEKYLQILHPDYVCCIADNEGRLCAFAIVLPSYAKALQKSKGRLFPFGWWHLWQASRQNDTAEFLLIGVLPEYRRKGITAILFKEMYDSFKKNKIRFVETNPMLIENKSVQNLWSDFNPVIHKRRKTFRIYAENLG